MGPFRPGHRHAVAAGMALMLLGYFAFALNDALGKYLVESFGVAQVVAVRAVGGLLILGPLLGLTGDHPWRGVHRPMLQVLRVVFATLDTALFYAACVYLPLADVMTFYMAGPIYTLVASYLFLGERIGWRRWAAILVGFVGVLIALRPSSASFTPAALYAIAGSVSYSLALVLNRILARTPDAVLGLYQTVGALIGAGGFAVLDWRPLTGSGVVYMLVLGVVGTVAHLLIIRASRLAPVSLLAPFQYTLLLWGIVMGIAFFGDVPGPNVILGSVVIIVAGLFIFHREERKAGPARTAETTVNMP